MARRKNGTGSLYYDPIRDKWNAKITDPFGKLLFERFDTAEEGDNWLLEMQYNFQSSKYLQKTDITIGQWFMRWMTIFKLDLRDKSKMQYLQTSKYLEPIVDIKLQEINITQIQMLLNNLPKDMASSSKIKVYQLLYSLFKKAVELRMIETNLMISVSKPRLISDHEVKIFTKDELKILFDYLKRDDIRGTLKKMYPLILFLANSGARIGETLALKWRDVYPEGLTIQINSNLQYIPDKGMVEFPPKTKAGKRNIRIPRHVIKAIMSLKNDDYSKSFNYVFHTKNGTPYSYRNISKYWKDIMNGAGLEYKSIHVLRHTNATQLLAEGIPILEVARRLGHARTSHTLDLYGHSIPKLDNQIGERIEEIFPK